MDNLVFALFVIAIVAVFVIVAVKLLKKKSITPSNGAVNMPPPNPKDEERGSKV
jgi:hypothetical protein